MTCLTLHELQSITFVYFWRIEWIQPISISWIFVRNYSLLFNSSEVPTRPFRPLMIFFLFISRKCVFGRIRQIKADDMSHAIIWANYSPPDDIKNSLSRPDDMFCWRVEKCYGWRSYRSYRIFLGSQLMGEIGGRGGFRECLPHQS